MRDYKTEQVAFRFTKALLRRLDRFAERLSRETGARVTRADAVRVLLKQALDQADYRHADGKAP